MYVRIPSMKEEFVKHGFMAALPTNYSGDENAPRQGRKSEMYGDADKLERKTIAEKPAEKPKED